jgi:hypothetical protein
MTEIFSLHGENYGHKMSFFFSMLSKFSPFIEMFLVIMEKILDITEKKSVIMERNCHEAMNFSTIIAVPADVKQSSR